MKYKKLAKMKNRAVIKKADKDLVNQIKRSLEDLKSGRVRRVA